MFSAVLSAASTLPHTAKAGNATWRPVPASGDWNTAGNWVAGVIPGNAAGDTATFGPSSITELTSPATVLLDAIVFAAGGRAFDFTIKGQLTFAGAGVTNSSGSSQLFITSGEASPTNGAVSFTGSASAGADSYFVNNGGTGALGVGGRTLFYDNSSAASAAFTNYAGTSDSFASGSTTFDDHSTAADGIFSNVGASLGAVSGTTYFYKDSTAAQGYFRNEGAAPGGGGRTEFHDRSTGADGTFTEEGGFSGGIAGGVVMFLDQSTAGEGHYTNLGGAIASAGPGRVAFLGTSDAGTGVFVNEGATAALGVGGQITFSDATSAGHATLTNYGSTRTNIDASGWTTFSGNATAANATIVANGAAGGTGGRITFFDTSTGGSARVEVFGNGSLDAGNHAAPGFSVGSIEGSGIVFLGSNNLAVGANDLDTTFSGAIQDGGPHSGTGGAFTKIGLGTLTLSGANSYTGGTTISAGTLLANNSQDSALGTGPVTVASGGTLGGGGFVGGQTTVANGGRLAPGNPTGALTFTQGLNLAAGAVLDFRLGTATTSIEVTGGALVVAPSPGGVTINLADAGGLVTGVPYTLIKFTAGLGSGLSVANFSLGRLIGADTAANYALRFTDSALVVTRQTGTRLVNIATRAYCGTNNAVTIGGFVISGTASKRVLVRAVGPSLTSQGLAAGEVLLDPAVEVHDAVHGNSILATNDNWTDNANSAEITTTATTVGATALLAGDLKSSALLLTLTPGVYSFVVTGKNATSGVVLLEVYDADTVSTDATFTNIATRAYATTGNGVTIGGFVISGHAPKQVLLRAVGPTLTTQGIAAGEVLVDPQIELHDASHGNAVIATNDNWGDNANAATITTTGARIGATPFAAADTKSSALLLTLDPGVYSFIASGKSTAPSGIVLVEVYDAD